MVDSREHIKLNGSSVEQDVVFKVDMMRETKPGKDTSDTAKRGKIRWRNGSRRVRRQDEPGTSF